VRRSQPSAILASLPLAKYHQIYLVLRQQLEDGRFAQGLPPEMELTNYFGVGRVTVRRALEQLAQEGLIVRTAGRGTRPTSRAEKAAQGHAHVHADHPATRLAGLLENIVDVSRRTSVKVLEWRFLQAPEPIAQALQIPVAHALRKVVRRRSSSLGPVSHITTYLPEERARGFSRSDLAQKPLLQLLEESGVEWGRARQTVSARAG
jgi:GntR family transcriptional regulator